MLAVENFLKKLTLQSVNINENNYLCRSKVYFIKNIEYEIYNFK
jgi:hypothetical protein